MEQLESEMQGTKVPTEIPRKLWVYTNFDCNLRCSYCVAESSPRAPRREVDFEVVKQIVDQAVELKIEHIYFTGGEPFILKDIHQMLSFSSHRLPTTVLTNAMLFNGSRFDKLVAINNPNLIVQVSLDGANPQQHDPYRGEGSWGKTIQGLQALLEKGFNVSISTTETSANADHLEELRAYGQSLGVPSEDHIIRPLAKRGFSDQGMEVSKSCLVPEMTITNDGVFWHPLSTDQDMLVTKEIFPLSEAFIQLQAEFDEIVQGEKTGMHEFQ
jgi:MoaA/NifB/PqqE/SkfB family radical SAM enzyme